MAPGVAQTASFVLIMILFHYYYLFAFIFCSIYSSTLSFCSFSFFWVSFSSVQPPLLVWEQSVLFQKGSSQCGRESSWRGCSNPELCKSCAPLWGFVHLAVLNRQDNLHLSPSVQHHLLHFLACAVKIPHCFWATDPAFSPSACPLHTDQLHHCNSGMAHTASVK